MLNFRKTKKMEYDDKTGKYGTKNAGKDDQSRYEMKVTDFLKYCRDFEQSLSKKEKDGELKTIGDVRKCFNDSFKGYYKGSKKFGIFSRTTRVLNEMDKKLKKCEKTELSSKEAEGKLKEAFKYTSKRDDKKEKGSRAAVDDRVVYNFFSEDILDTIKELMENTNQNFVNDKDLKEFVTRILKKLGEIKETTKKTRKSVQQTKQTIDKTQKDATVVTRNSMVDKEMKRKSELVQQASKRNSVELKKVDGNNNKIEEDTDKVAKELGNLKDKPLTPEKMVELEKKAELLGQKAEDNKKQVEVIQEVAKENMEKVEEVQMKVEEKKEQNKLFEVEGKTLIIRGDEGLKEFCSLDKNSGKGLDFRMKCNALQLDGVRSIDKKEAFWDFESITTVEASNLKGKICEGAFGMCKGLNSFNKQGEYSIIGANEIGKSAFVETALAKVNLAAETIGEEAFGGCTNLTTVTLGQEKVEIGENAFCPDNELTINVRNEAVGEAILKNCEKYKDKLKVLCNGQEIKLEDQKK